MFRLKERLLTKSGALTKVFDVEVCPGSGWKMELAHLTREGFDRLIKKHTRQVFSKDRDGMKEKTDLDGLYADYADKIVLGWSGLTIETLKTLVAFDATGTKDTDELPYDHETCVALLKGAQHLDTWITSVASNPGRFQSNGTERSAEEGELKN